MILRLLLVAWFGMGTANFAWAVDPVVAEFNAVESTNDTARRHRRIWSQDNIHSSLPSFDTRFRRRLDFILYFR